MAFPGDIAHLRIVLMRAVLFAPAILLATAALTQLPSALAHERAFPVPTFMSMNIPLAEGAYPQTASILNSANATDGEAHIFEAEAAMIAGTPTAEVREILRSALNRAPSSALGWTLLAEAEAQTDQAHAASALATAFALAPHDYLLTPRQSFIAAALWPSLSEETRNLALRRARLLWTEQRLRPIILQLAQDEAGAQLMTQAFVDEPDALAALIDWVDAERRRASGAS